MVSDDRFPWVKNFRSLNTNPWLSIIHPPLEGLVADQISMAKQLQHVTIGELREKWLQQYNGPALQLNKCTLFGKIVYINLFISFCAKIHLRMASCY